MSGLGLHFDFITFIALVIESGSLIGEPLDGDFASLAFVARRDDLFGAVGVAVAPRLALLAFDAVAPKLRLDSFLDESPAFFRGLRAGDALGGAGIVGITALADAPGDGGRATGGT